MSQDQLSCQCPKCGKTFRVPPEMVGKRIVCKGCQTHFSVQPAKTGAAAAPAASAAAPAKSPAASNVPVTAASSAPAPVPTPTDDLPPIPLDDTFTSVSVEKPRPAAEAASTHSESKGEKIKIESSGPYLILKLYLPSKSLQVELEKQLNEYSEDGWRLQQVLPVGETGYAILYRDPSLKKPEKPAPLSS